MVKATRSVDLEPIDRLEEKVRSLVAQIERLRADQARAAEETRRLAADLDAARARLADAEAAGAEVLSLRAERDQIRTRVVDMLEQLETLNL